MTVLVSDPDFTLHVGDARTVLPTLEAESVDCVATSPPFYSLRDYNVEGQIGLEASPDEWVAELVAVFHECHRILRPAGTLWVECGDSYANLDGQGNKADQRGIGQSGAFNVSPSLLAVAGDRGLKHSIPAGYKRKDLIGAPWLLAFALRADGWYLRQAIVWHKPNAMPESAQDRCTTAHSYVFLFSKRPRYWFDADAIAEESITGDLRRPYGSEGAWQMDGRPVEQRHGGELRAVGGRTTNGQKPRTDERRGFDNRLERVDGMKNARSVWAIPTRGYPGAHFATWPEALAGRIIKAGCPEGGLVLDPFGGTGTTALVARQLGRRSVLIELNPDYAELAARRLQQLSLLA